MHFSEAVASDKRMTSHLNADEEFIALLSEIHNAITEAQTAASLSSSESRVEPNDMSTSTRLAQIPSDLLAALHKLAPKATKSAFSLLDTGTRVEALACDNDLVFVVCDHIALVHGFELQPSDSLTPKVTGATAQHTCDCPSYTYGTDNFCKHIVAAGLVAVAGAATISHVDRITLSEKLNAGAAVTSTPRAPTR